MFCPNFRTIVSLLSRAGRDSGSRSAKRNVALSPGWITSLMVSGIVLIIQQVGGFQGLELRLLDRFIRWRSHSEPDPRLLVVTITEADLKTQGWPLSDRVLAQTLAKLQQYQPRVIGIDLYRDLPQAPGTEELAAQLQAKNVIAITNIGNPGIPPPPDVPLERIGFNDVPLGPDGVVRRQLLFGNTQSQTWYSLALRLSLSYLEREGIEPQSSARNPDYMQLGKAVFIPLKKWQGGYTKIDDQGYQILLDYRTHNIAKTVTLGEILTNQVNRNWIQDKIVLIGATAPSLKDAFFTPYSAAASKNPMMSGVFIHAQMVSQIISVALQDFGTRTPPNLWVSPRLFWFLPRWGEWIWILSWAAIGGLSVWCIQHPFKQGIALTVEVVSLFGISYSLFALQGWLPFVAPALTLVLSGFGVIAYKQIHYVIYDPLTGLPNRTSLLEKLQSALTQAQWHQNLCGVLFLNIDRFQMINESLGHSAGDQFLVKITQRLKSCIRSNDTIARLGGDEFAVVIENLRQCENAIQVAERIHQVMMAPFEIEGQAVFRTISIGIALSDTTDGKAEDLLRNANTAMYQAKNQGTATYQVYERKMNVDSRQRLQLETDLRLALQRQEFVLYYQPLVSLKTGKIVGLEALLRWQHPEHDLLIPDEFIDVAKETGLIVPIGEWAIREACLQLRVLQDKFGVDCGLIMGVNISGRQLNQPDLVSQIQEIILKSGVKADGLRLEITESVVMDDVAAMISLLERLKQLNVKLSIDDFGTGFSSLSFLHHFPVDGIKIDQRFVGKIEEDDRGENLAIVKTIITLTHILQLEAIAEGVETAQQLEKLRTLGCELAQGYYFLQPVPAEIAIAFIESNPQW